MTAPRPDRPTEPVSPRTPRPTSTERRTPPTRDASFAPQLLGGVVLGMGLTVLCIALDRADLPSPIPASLSWHHPDRVRADAIERMRAARYADLEVALVEAVVIADLSDTHRERALRYLWQRGGDADVRAWAATELAPVPTSRVAVDPVAPPSPTPTALADGLSVDGGPWLSTWLEPPVSEVVVSLVADHEPAVSWLDDALEDSEWTLPDVEPEPEPEPETRPADVGTAPAERAPDEDPPTATAPPTPDAAAEPAPAPAADTSPDPDVTAAPPEEAAVAHAPSPRAAEEPARDEAAATVVEAPVVSLTPHVTVSQTFVDAERGDAAAVAPVVADHVGQLRQCYERGLEFDPALGGMLDLELTIRNGRVSAVSVIAENLGDEIAIRCMTDRIRHWRFDTGLAGQAGYRFGFDLTSG